MEQNIPETPEPDWSKIQEEIGCPLCDHNLRGLARPQCPECGYWFTWAEVLDTTRRRHPYLFEHHPSRNFWSFFRTLQGEPLTNRFWTKLHPSQKPARLRLLAYWFIITLAVLSPIGLSVGWKAIPPDESTWGRWMPRYAAPHYGVERELFAVLATAALPIATLAVLLIFQESMRKARVGMHHVVRCVVYSFDFAFYAGLLFGGFALYATAAPAGSISADSVAVLSVCVLVSVWLMMAGRLYLAYRYYLRFPHPLAVVAAVEIILFLGLLDIIGNLMM